MDLLNSNSTKNYKDSRAMTKITNLPELNTFITNWKTHSLDMKNGFIMLIDSLKDKAGIEFDFVERPGVSYSLRPKHNHQKDRNLFAMMDVIDDNPEERWLSICFYEDMITDPEGMGELIPEGLSGSDGYCFDLYDHDEEELNYLKKRLEEAYVSASA